MRSVRVSCLQGKAKYPEKVNQVPGLKCEGAACSGGLDIRHADGLDNFSVHLYRTLFIFNTFLKQEID